MSEDFNDPGPSDPGWGWSHHPVDLNEIEREKTRRIIVVVVLAGLLLQFPIAAAAVALGSSWDGVKDALAYAIAPIVALASIIGYSYFK